jgi:RNA polymerase sigma-B factor
VTQTTERLTMTQKKSSGESIQDEAEGLFARYARTRDPQLRDRLVLMHHNLVRYLAGKFVNRGEPLEDLVQVGTIGLINAIDRFDAGRGTKFSTYATPTVVGEIRRYFRDKAWSLKVPRRLQELNQSSARVHEELTNALGRPPTIQEVAVRIGATEEETLEAMELGNAYDTISLDSRLPSESDGAPMSLGEFVGAEDESITTIAKYGDLDLALSKLDPRERAIIVHRFFSDMSQAEVAKQLSISQMHVSRLQSRALVNLRKLMDDEQ